MTTSQKAHQELVHEQLRILEKEIDRIFTITEQPAGFAWHPATDVPPPGRYIVRTKDGATFFLEPVGNKWLPNIVKWAYIPD